MLFRRYKTLFADDRPDQFDLFSEVSVERLKSRGMLLDPLDYARTVYRVESEPGESVEEFLEYAEARNAPYDLLITDLNFEPGGLGGGRRDGFSALSMAKEKWPAIKLVLITGYGTSISAKEAIKIATETGLKEGHWIDLTGAGVQEWHNIATVCELLCEAIDADRLGPPKAAPDLYEIVVTKHNSARPDAGAQEEQLLFYIMEKAADGKRSSTIRLDGDHALVLQVIAYGEGMPVSGKSLLNTLNRFTQGAPLQLGADRRKVQEIRRNYLQELDAVFGPGFSGDKGIIKTIHGRGGGYALSGSIVFSDK